MATPPLNTTFDRAVKAPLLRGLKAAGVFLRSKVRAALSKNAPKKRARGGLRAATPAAPGAPPRKVSGRLYASADYEVDPAALTVRVGASAPYAKYLEGGGHPFLAPTLEKNRAEAGEVLRRAAGAGG